MFKSNFEKLFEKYRGPAALEKLKANSFYYDRYSERGIAAARAEKSDDWADRLNSDNLALNQGALDNVSFDFDIPQFNTPPSEALEFMKMFIDHFEVRSHYEPMMSTASCSLYIETLGLVGDGVITAQPAYEIAHPQLFKGGKEWSCGESEFGALQYYEDYHKDVNTEYFNEQGAQLITPWFPWGKSKGARYLDILEAVAVTANCLHNDGFIVAWLPTEDLGRCSLSYKHAASFKTEGLCVKAVYVLPVKLSYGVEKESSLVILKKGEWQSHCYVNRMPQSKAKLLQSFAHWDEKHFAKSGGNWMEINLLNVDYSDILEWRKAKKSLVRAGYRMSPFLDHFSQVSGPDPESGVRLSFVVGGENWEAKQFPTGATYLSFVQSKYGRIWRKRYSKLPPSAIMIPVPNAKLISSRIPVIGFETSILKSQLNEAYEKAFLGEADALSLLKAKMETGVLNDLCERLPWPLSSILKAYVVEKDVRLKADRLNYFFEAASVFLPTLLLSLIWQNEDLKGSLFSRRTDELTSSKKNRFESPAMGAWNTLFGSLQRFMRQEMSKLGGDADGLSSKLGGVSVDLLKKLTDKGLFSLIDQARSGRNDRAHWGALGQEEYEDVLERLEDCLTQFNAAVGYAFSRSPLISPLNGSTSFLGNETFEMTVRKLIGSSESFDRVKVQLQAPLANNQVYLYTPDEKEAIQVLPFIFVDEQNICHFYNRVEKEGVRYVSYQADLATNTVIRPKNDLMTEVLDYLG